MVEVWEKYFPPKGNLVSENEYSGYKPQSLVLDNNFKDKKESIVCVYEWNWILEVKETQESMIYQRSQKDQTELVYRTLKVLRDEVCIARKWGVS